MAQGDIIDTMFGWIMELFGWIFNMLLKLVISIVKGIFNLLGMGIKAIFARKENNTPES